MLLIWSSGLYCCLFIYIWRIHAGWFSYNFIFIKMSLEVLQCWTRDMRLQTLETSGPSLLGHWQSSSTYTVICLVAQLYVLTSLKWLIALGKKKKKRMVLVTVVEKTASNLFCPLHQLFSDCCMVVPRSSRVGLLWLDTMQLHNALDIILCITYPNWLLKRLLFPSWFWEERRLKGLDSSGGK